MQNSRTRRNLRSTFRRFIRGKSGKFLLLSFIGLSKGIRNNPSSKKSQAGKDNEKDFYTCPQCGRFTWEFNFYQKHLSTHSNIYPFKCSICSQSFKHADSFQRHVGVHSKQKLFICKVCKAYFSKNDFLVAHMKTHEKTIKCPYCDMAYSKKGYLEWHLETIHKGLPGIIEKQGVHKN